MSIQTLSRSPVAAEQSKKILYIDNLKVALITLVVVQHALITYGVNAGWYYTERTTHIAAIIPMDLLAVINQSFFMGLYFFLSAFFMPASYDKKGIRRFLKDRLLRLGIPWVFYSFILSPVMIYLVYYFGDKHHIPFIKFLGGFHAWINFGVLWFVAALILFTLVYILWRILTKRNPSKSITVPSSKMILWFAAGVGVISFFVRIVFPIGWILNPVGFQLAYFSQYVALFILGLVAAKNNWLDTFSYKVGKPFARYALRLLSFLILIAVLEKLGTPEAWFIGGFHWQQLLYAVWEQMLGFSIIVALLTFGKKLWNRSCFLMAKLSRSAFAVYIFHPLVLVTLALSLRNWEVDPAVKFLVVAPLGIGVSFLVGRVVTMIPGVRKII
jgi:Acyltransferase family